MTDELKIRLADMILAFISDNACDTKNEKEKLQVDQPLQSEKSCQNCKYEIHPGSDYPCRDCMISVEQPFRLWEEKDDWMRKINDDQKGQ